MYATQSWLTSPSIRSNMITSLLSTKLKIFLSIFISSFVTLILTQYYLNVNGFFNFFCKPGINPRLFRTSDRVVLRHWAGMASCRDSSELKRSPPSLPSQRATGQSIRQCRTHPLFLPTFHILQFLRVNICLPFAAPAGSAQSHRPQPKGRLALAALHFVRGIPFGDPPSQDQLLRNQPSYQVCTRHKLFSPLPPGLYSGEFLQFSPCSKPQIPHSSMGLSLSFQSTSTYVIIGGREGINFPATPDILFPVYQFLLVLL